MRQGNGFDNTYGGIYVSNSAILDDELYKNSFNTIPVGIQTQQNNAPLQIRCNDYSNVVYNIAITSGSIRNPQGDCLPALTQGEYESPSNNQLSHNCIDPGNQGDIFTGVGSDYNVNNKLTYNTLNDLLPVCYSAAVSPNGCVQGFLGNETIACPPIGGTPSELRSEIDDLAEKIQDLKDQASSPPTQQEQKEIDFYTDKRQLKINELTRSYISNQYPDSAIGYLDTLATDTTDENTLEARFMLVPLAIDDEDAVKAQDILDRIPQDNDESTQYCNYQQICIDLLNANKTFFDMDTTQEQSMRNIANTSTQASRFAQSVLHYVYNDTIQIIQEDIDSTEGSKRSNQINEEKLLVNEIKDMKLKIYPNPASNEVIIEAYFAEAHSDAVISVYNLIGNKLVVIPLNKVENRIELNTEDWNNGIYPYTLSFNGSVKEKGKISIFK